MQQSFLSTCGVALTGSTNNLSCNGVFYIERMHQRAREKSAIYAILNDGRSLSQMTDVTSWTKDPKCREDAPITGVCFFLAWNLNLNFHLKFITLFFTISYLDNFWLLTLVANVDIV